MGSVESSNYVSTEEVKRSKTINELTREEKDELKALSKEVYGSSSRWQKMVNNGHPEAVTEEITEYVPNPEDEEKEGTTKQTTVPVKYANGAHKLVIKRYSVDEIRTVMLDRKKKIEEIRAMIKKDQEERKAKEAKEATIKKVQEELGGSAL